ncbi:MAG: hypothetical protein ABL936_07240 [Aestuariivirga sp.]
MTAITFNWVPFGIETEVDAPTKSQVKSSGRCSREEEFRTALESYMADYRKNRRTIEAKKLL